MGLESHMTIRRTVVKGPFVFGQDVTKQEDFIWRPDDSIADGTAAPVHLGIDGIQHISTDAGDVITYETRDGRKVIRFALDWSTWKFTRAGLPDQRNAYEQMRPGDVLSTIAYLNLGEIRFGISNPAYTAYISYQLKAYTTPFTGRFAWGYSSDEYGGALYGDEYRFDTTGWVAGWYYMAARIAADGRCSIKLYPEASPTDWVELVVPEDFLWYWAAGQAHWAAEIAAGDPHDPAAFTDIYEIRLERA